MHNNAKNLPDADLGHLLTDTREPPLLPGWQHDECVSWLFGKCRRRLESGNEILVTAQGETDRDRAAPHFSHGGMAFNLIDYTAGLEMAMCLFVNGPNRV